MKKLENVGKKLLQPEYFGNYNNIGFKLGSVSTASVAKVAPHLERNQPAGMRFSLRSFPAGLLLRSKELVLPVAQVWPSCSG